MSVEFAFNNIVGSIKVCLEADEKLAQFQQCVKVLNSILAEAAKKTSIKEVLNDMDFAQERLDYMVTLNRDLFRINVKLDYALNDITKELDQSVRALQEHIMQSRTRFVFMANA